MNYAFKIMAVVLALGVLVLQGCQTIAGKHKIGQVSSINNSKICIYSSKDGKWRTEGYSQKFVNEAKRRGLDCADYILSSNNQKEKTVTASKDKGITFFNPENIAHDYNVCYHATIKINNIIYWNMKNPKLVKEAKRRGLYCSGAKENNNVLASKPKTQTFTQPKSTISSSELDASKREADELRKKLTALENKQKQEKQRINKDNQEPIINAFIKQNGSNANISGRVTDNIEVAEVLINGQTQQFSPNGTFETKLYIPRTGKTVEIVAFDTKGNKASKTMKIERGNIQQANIQQFKSLNPSIKKVKGNPNALALIIGIAKYENTKAALYADSDAKTFYDYATMKLGIPSSNIKELINEGADRIDITRAIKTWLLKRTVTDKTDIFIFFAGHGLAANNIKGMYLIPYDGVVPDLLEDSAILRKRFFADIQATKPRSVTVFLDTCYSGGTRNEEETLVANLRPVIITAKEQAIPDNFTVLSAAKGNQTSESLDEVKHGLFSYYMMLGMEGGADLNADKKITARELHEYLVDKVERQSQFRQTPELQGDKDRVLVQFN